MSEPTAPCNVLRLSWFVLQYCLVLFNVSSFVLTLWFHLYVTVQILMLANVWPSSLKDSSKGGQAFLLFVLSHANSQRRCGACMRSGFSNWRYRNESRGRNHFRIAFSGRLRFERGLRITWALSGCEGCRLPECDAMLSGRSMPAFRRIPILQH